MSQITTGTKYRQTNKPADSESGAGYMSQPQVRTRLLVAAMTYPHPSKKYRELVCTAGISERGEWLRLYPVDYRYRQPHQKFRKYQWIEIDLSPCGEAGDLRRESRKPDLNTIKILGPPLPTEDSWRDRRAIVDALPHRTLKEWKALYDQEKISLGVIRPKRVLDVQIRPAEPDWKPEWKSMYDQLWLRLFDPPKPLRKLPRTFHYIFECEDSHGPEEAMITDWELGTLFLRESVRLGSDEAAAESVKKKYLKELCGPARDTRFFVGTRLPFNVWLVIGVFWPPKLPKQSKQFFQQEHK